MGTKVSDERLREIKGLCDSAAADFPTATAKQRFDLEEVGAMVTELLALRAPAEAEAVAWQCAKCKCRSYARVDRLSFSGQRAFEPGHYVRCVECKDVSFFPAPHPAPAPDVVEALSVDEIEQIIIRTEPDIPASVDHEKIWTRRMAVGLHASLSTRGREAGAAAVPDVKVKTLGWRDNAAGSIVGVYRIVDVTEFLGDPRFDIWLEAGSGEDASGFYVEGGFDNVETARAAAQADYEARILRLTRAARAALVKP
ncbi:MAG: hypothetical protein WC829_06880 [Hyphomicrobium sp.]